MIKINKKIVPWIVLAVVAGVAIFAFTRHRAPLPLSTKSSAAAYSTAVKQYEGRRIQFDMYCQAIPTSLVFKNGVSLMLDNRSGDARTITIGGTPYYLAGYGWKVVTLSVSASQLPKTLSINCGSAVNVSHILLE
jgi:hypothetical protein